MFASFRAWSARLVRRSHHVTIWICTLLLLTPAAFALEGRILLPNGKAAAGSQVSILGIAGSVRADSEGRFPIDKRTKVPFVLVIIGPGGEIYPTVTVTEVPRDVALEVHLEPGLRESLTVTSGVAPNIEAPPAAGTTVIGREDLEERHPEHLVEALARMAGMQIRGEGPPAVPVLRGLAGGRTLLLFDDARVTAERRAGPSGTFLDPFSLASIEVSRGPGSVAYGSDALGGVIHARPRDPVPEDGRLRYDTTASFGGRELKSGGIEYTHDAGRGALLALLHARQGDDGEGGNGTRILNSSYEDRGGALRFVAPTRQGFLRAGLTVDQARNVGVPAADANVQPAYYPAETSRRLTLSWDTTPSHGLTHLEIRAALGSYGIITNRERLPNATTTRQIASAGVDANDVSLRIAGNRVGNRGRLHAGFDFNSRFNLHATGFAQQFNAAESPTTRTSEVSIDDAHKRDAGLFVIYDWSAAPKLALSGGARADRVETKNSGGFFGDRSRQDTALSGHAAATYIQRAGLTATIQVASGYRDPTLSDRFFRGVSGRGFVVGNPDLDPERSLQFDGAVRWQSSKRSLAFLGYHYRIRHLIERFRQGSDFNFRNRGEAEVRGLEIEAATPLPYRLSLMANATIARGEALDGGTPLDDIAAPNAHVALRWEGGRASAFVYGFLFARDNRPGPVEAERPGYATFDLGLGWHFSERAEIRLHVRNLTDRNYAGSPDANASLAPGRSISIGLGGQL